MVVNLRLYEPLKYWSERARKYHKEPLKAVGYIGALDYYNKYADFLHSSALHRALPNLKNLKVLDVGCGVGRMSFPLETRGAEVVGIDISKEMLKLAREKAKRKGANIPLCTASASNLPFVENSFDLVISVTVLQHIVDDATVFHAAQEMVRTTKKGGSTIALEHVVRSKESTNFHMAFRTRENWRRFFNSCGTKLFKEISVGVAPFSRWIFSFGKMFMKKKGAKTGFANEFKGVEDVLENLNPLVVVFFKFSLCFSIILSKPIDAFFLSKSRPSALAEEMLFQFKKE